MSDEQLRQLERELASDPSKQEAYDKARLRSGALTEIWVLQYAKDSVGLDGSIVGIFTNRQAAVDHIKLHEKHFYPGNHSRNPSVCRKKRDESYHQWTNGYRGLNIRKISVRSTADPDEWFTSHGLL